MFTIDASLVKKFPTTTEEKQLLKSVFKDNKWETPDILERLDNVEYIYFDNVSQVKWTTGIKVELL